MMLLIFKYKKLNLMMILYGAAYAVFRFTIEFWRGDYRGGAGEIEAGSQYSFQGLSPSQWQSFILIAAVIALAVAVFYFKKIPFYKPIPATETAQADAAPESSDEFYAPADAKTARVPEPDEPETTEEPEATDEPEHKD